MSAARARLVEALDVWGAIDHHWRGADVHHRFGLQHSKVLGFPH
jgi:hypothetical protein